MTTILTYKQISLYYQSKTIFLFLPNIIDYLRLLFLLLAFYFWKTNPILFIFNYFMCYLLDEFDGILARRLNQTSKFGAILDMVIDRIATVALLGVLAIFYPDFSSFFLALQMLDIGSHWLQTHSACLVSMENHKNLKEDYWIVEFYYTSRSALCVICWFAEIFLVQLYYINFDVQICDKLWFIILLFVSLFFYLVKQIISVLQVVSSSKRIANYDVNEYIQRSILEVKMRSLGK